jgi:L-amino acid N-acyltransferase
MKFISCDGQYAAEILAIFNEAILHSTAIYDYKPRDLAYMHEWFEAKQKACFPVIGLLNEDDLLVGFGTYGRFRDRPAYKYTIEHSLYVHTDHRGKGYGRLILKTLIEHARASGYHNIIGGIDSGNEVSIILHKSLGFEHAGTIRQAGYKFSQWLDLDFYQLLLATPEHPVEG